jgi:NAD(P)H-hydrate epimerase
MSVQALYFAPSLQRLTQLARQRPEIKAHTLMLRAGQAALQALQQHWPKAQKIIVVCGLGNNAGDGYVLARLAVAQGLQVELFQIGNPQAALKAEQANHAKQAFLALGQKVQPLPKQLPSCEVVVDALLGIGYRGPLTPQAKQAITLINASSSPVLALDLPSGIDAYSGAIAELVVEAEVTITFLAQKIALLTGLAPNYSKEVVFADLQIPASTFESVAWDAAILTLNDSIACLPARKRCAHKGNTGQLLIVGAGTPGFCGAVGLAGCAALYSGTGAVTALMPEKSAQQLRQIPLELMCHPFSHMAQVANLCQAATALVLGPGLGQSRWAYKMFVTITATQLPMVVDADGLNWLAQYPQQNPNWVLTPHPKEAARLLNCSVEEIQADRVQAVRRLQQKYLGVIVLKGAGTLIYAPDTIPWLCTAGNPGMAVAGMGDILAGLIGSLMAQGLPLLASAKLGVIIHAQAGDLAQLNGQRGMLASDLLPYFRSLFHQFAR